MTEDELHELAIAVCESMPGAEETHPFGPEPTVYKVAGKMYALIGTGPGVLGMNLKIPPEDGDGLRQMEGITPGWHMNKKHWITVDFIDAVEPSLLTELIEDSYEIVRSALPKKIRLALGDPKL